MANSYTQIIIHLTFHVKEGCQIDKSDLSSLYKYIMGIIVAEGGAVFAIGGVSNHIHILFSLPKNTTLSSMVMKIKANSSRWLKGLRSQYRAFAWQDGYGAFSVSASKIETVVAYIGNQEEHHRKHSFKEEYVEFLKAYNVDYDERYL